jgi:uncharacterized protein (TIGR03437 family)
LGNPISGVEIKGEATCGGIQLGLPVPRTVVSDNDGSFEWPYGTPGGAGSGCQLTTVYTFMLNKPGYVFTREKFRLRTQVPPDGACTKTYDTRIPLIHGAPLTQPQWTSVSAASFDGEQVLASEAIVAGFGVNLATKTEVSALPLPTTLADRRVILRDSTGAEKAAKLLFISPSQINYLTPEGLAEGSAVTKLTDQNDNLLSFGFVEIKKSGPGIFTANASGEDVPSAVIVRVKPGNEQIYEPVAQYDETQNRFVPIPIDLGPETEIVVLAIFGTGWRKLTPADVAVYATTNSDFTSFGCWEATVCPLEYIGTQPTFEGLDQINVRLPRTLIGKGDLNFYLNDERIGSNGRLPISNIVHLKIK